MNTTRDTHHTETADGDGELDPREAASLLEQTQWRARRQLSRHAPLPLVIGAAIVLGCYGSIWLSVRGQHPYVGPSLGVVGFVYTLVVVGAVTTTTMYKRSVTGVSGRSRREDKIAAIPVVVAFVSVYVFMGALGYDGFSHAVVYGVFDAAAPWMVVGTAMAAAAAAREEWLKLAGATAIVVIGTASAFTGPINVWGVLAVGGCVGLMVAAVVQIILFRRP